MVNFFKKLINKINKHSPKQLHECPNTPVSAGEVCTIEQAKLLGIFDNKNYIKPSNTNFADLKTFNSDKDNSENRNKFICRESITGKTANIACIFEHGPGYIRKPGNPDMCITYDCPPGFKRTGNNCEKILKDAIVDKRSHCDERPNDWFLIPNYQLGNKYYQESVGKCYAPCKNGQVPLYAKDPVDNARVDFTSKDNPLECASKDDYFEGKYQGSQDYCPIAMIHRLNATPAIMTNKILSQIRAGNSNVSTNDNFNKLLKDAPHQANQIYKQASSVITNVDMPTDTMQIACNKINTPERVQEAYNLCEKLKNSEEDVIHMFAQAGDSPAIQTDKIIMLKQACNAVFCNENDSAFDNINGEPICFRNSQQITIDKNGNSVAQNIPEYPDDKPAPTADSQQNVLFNVLTYFIVIIMIPIFCVLFFELWRKFLWPKIFRKIFREIKYLIIGNHRQSDAFRDMATNPMLNKAAR
jgi:CTP:molybdopterin cytidylyltransferase MocA